MNLQTKKTHEIEPVPEVGIKRITVAMVGNPNSGKTTLFNTITGSQQHVGNYPGVTVEKKTGLRKHKDYDMTFVDLPGTYSMNPFSIEERIVRDFIIAEKPDVVIDIIDTSNLERSLYLTTQVIELGSPMVLALNMSDEADKHGIKIDSRLMAELLDAPVVRTIASKEKGITELLNEIISVAERKKVKNVQVNYGVEMEESIAGIISMLEKLESPIGKYPPRWTAIRLMENDSELIQFVGIDSPIVDFASRKRELLHQQFGEDTEILIADSRYGFVAGILKETVQTVIQSRKDLTEKIDIVLVNRILGIPIFMFMMWLTFQLTFKVGVYPMTWMETGFEKIAALISSFLPPGFASSLLIDGVIGGVGGVLVFLPNILLLFLAISFLEDSGYMARAAFLMDKLMHSIGLHGKSFMPMLIGFGCSVPAIMATRSLENEKDRLKTMLIIPMMSCGARLPVYILLAGAFFPAQAGNMIFMLYIFGILMAILMAFILDRFFLKGPGTPFVMELPPYRLPTLKSVFLHMWRRAKLYMKKAGTIILAASMIIWFATTFPFPWDPSFTTDYSSVPQSQRIQNSIAGHIGKAIEPVIRPLGFDWKIGISLVTGLVAKEVVVSTLGTVYSLENSDAGSTELQQALRSDKEFTPSAALALMFFTLIYVPCIAAISMLYRESGSTKWTVFAVVYTVVLAWIVAFAAHQVGNLFLT